MNTHLRSFVYLLILALSVHAQWNPVPAKTQEFKEGQLCDWDREAWTCRRISQCSMTNIRPRTKCLSTGNEPVVCCPLSARINKKPLPVSPVFTSISELKCREYQQAACKPILEVNVRSGVETEEFFETGTPEGWTNPDVGIYNGVDAMPAEFPHAALIGFGPEVDIVWSCGGSLVSEKFVLSAAHCSESSEDGIARWVMLGDTKYEDNTVDSGPQRFQIVARFVHEGYNGPRELYNDLVLFRLDRDAVFTRYVKPVCLYTGRQPTYGDMGTAAGWGMTRPNGDRSKSLMKVNLPYEDCSIRLRNATGRMLFPQGINKDTILCTYTLKSTTCEGDSGSGLLMVDKDQCLYRLVGVLSFSNTVCARHELPSGYMRVAAYISWIEKIVWNV